MLLPDTQFGIHQKLVLRLSGHVIPVTVTGIHHSLSTVNYDVQTTDGLLIRMVHGTYLALPVERVSDKPFAPS